MNAHSYLRPHNLRAGYMMLDTSEAAARLHETGSPNLSERAVTLVKQDGMCVVLTHLQAGGALHEHCVSGAATVQVLDGRVRARIGDETLDVQRGQVLAFETGIDHAVEAVDESMLLVTLAKSNGPPIPSRDGAHLPRFWMA